MAKFKKKNIIDDTIEKVEEAKKESNMFLNDKNEWTEENTKETEKLEEETAEFENDDLIELEKLIDEAIEEAEENEQQEEISQETLKEFEELSKMSVTNEKLHELILDMNNTLITAKREELIIDNKIFRSVEKVHDITNELNGKNNKRTAIQHGLFLVVGILVGLNGELWTPHLKELMEILKVWAKVAV